MTEQAPQAPPTLADIAARAEVSTATASRALSGSRAVSPEKLRRVTEAVRELGYRNNLLASALRQQRSGTIGLLLPRYSTGFLSSLMESIGSALDQRGMSLVLRYVDPEVQSSFDQVQALRDRRVDGIIMCAPSEDAATSAAASADTLPIVFVGRNSEFVEADSVGLDDDRATAMLIDHLALRGARSLAVFGLDPREPAEAHRLQALIFAAERRGLTVEVPFPSGQEIADGIAAVEKLLDSADPDFDAIVCSNDELALGALTALRMRAVAVPQHVQVASLRDVSYTEQNPRVITTLRHHWPEMGREAVRMLAAHISAESPPQLSTRVVLAPMLLPGESTLPLPVPAED